jgi:Secretion system C-terminal sorting domain
MQKNLISLFLLTFLSCQLFAQTQLITFNYWFDNDFTNNISLTLTTSDTNLNTNVNTSSLPIGLHRVNLRVKDVNGLWSPTVTQIFIREKIGVSNIVAYEYWFNSDLTNKVLVTLPGPISNLELNTANLIVNAANLPANLNPDTLHFRFLDGFGKWSSVVSETFTYLGYRFHGNVNDINLVSVNNSTAKLDTQLIVVANCEILLLKGGTIVQTTTPDQNGNYKFTGVPVDNYVIQAFYHDLTDTFNNVSITTNTLTQQVNNLYVHYSMNKQARIVSDTLSKLPFEINIVLDNFKIDLSKTLPTNIGGIIPLVKQYESDTIYNWIIAHRHLTETQQPLEIKRIGKTIINCLFAESCHKTALANLEKVANSMYGIGKSIYQIVKINNKAKEISNLTPLNQLQDATADALKDIIVEPLIDKFQSTIVKSLPKLFPDFPEFLPLAESYIYTFFNTVKLYAFDNDIASEFKKDFVKDAVCGLVTIPFRNLYIEKSSPFIDLTTDMYSQSAFIHNLNSDYLRVLSFNLSDYFTSFNEEIISKQITVNGWNTFDEVKNGGYLTQINNSAVYVYNAVGLPGLGAPLKAINAGFALQDVMSFTNIIERSIKQSTFIKSKLIDGESFVSARGTKPQYGSYKKIKRSSGLNNAISLYQVALDTIIFKINNSLIQNIGVELNQLVNQHLIIDSLLEIEYFPIKATILTSLNSIPDYDSIHNNIFLKKMAASKQMRLNVLQTLFALSLDTTNTDFIDSLNILNIPTYFSNDSLAFGLDSLKTLSNGVANPAYISIINNSRIDSMAINSSKPYSFSVKNFGSNIATNVFAVVICQSGLTSSMDTIQFASLPPDSSKSITFLLTSNGEQDSIKGFRIVLFGNNSNFTGTGGAIVFKMTLNPLILNNIILNGYSNDCLNVLNWKNVSIAKLGKIELQKSENNSSYKSIKTITKNFETNNVIDDAIANENMNSYRLKITDISGNEAYSNTINLKGNCNAEGQWTISPNPATDFINITHQIKGMHIKTCTILDASGRVMKRIEIAYNAGFDYNFNVQLAGLAKGVYLCKLEYKNGLSSGKEFIIK